MIDDRGNLRTVDNVALYELRLNHVLLMHVMVEMDDPHFHIVVRRPVEGSPLIMTSGRGTPRPYQPAHVSSTSVYKFVYENLGVLLAAVWMDGFVEKYAGAALHRESKFAATRPKDPLKIALN